MERKCFIFIILYPTNELQMMFEEIKKANNVAGNIWERNDLLDMKLYNCYTKYLGEI